MSKIEVDINAVIDQAASRIVEAVINKLNVPIQAQDNRLDYVSNSLRKMEGRVATLSVNCGRIEKFNERITALAETNDQDFVEIRKQVDTLDERVDKLTGQVQKLDNRFDNLQVLAADSAELTNMSARLDRLSHDIIELRGIKQDPASLVKRLEAVEENAIYLERIINQVKCILIIAAAKIQKEL